MCLDIIKNPAKSLAEAKKKRDINKTLIILVENAVLFAVAAGLIVARTGLAGGLLLTSVSAAFLFVLIGALLFGLVVQISATTLGGKGQYFEGLTSVVYSLTPISAGIFVVALLSLIPFTAGIQIIVMALSFALGFSLIYRGIKELYKTDMITAFVVVSVTILVIFAAIYVSMGLSLLGHFGSMSSGMMAY